MPVTFNPAPFGALTGLGERLPELSGDASYRAGRAYLKQGAVAQATVAGTTAYATVTGSTEYRISVAFGSELKVSCTCPAHRRNRYCKHVVAVCLALVEQPQSFPVTEAAPEPEVKAVAPRKRAARKPAGPSREELQQSGLATIDRLLTELTEVGLMGMGANQLELIRNVAELARGMKLRRLSALIDRLQHAVAHPQQGGLDEQAFARLLVDLELTRCVSAAYLEGGATMDPALAEDLIGKSWREQELEPVRGLELMEVGFQQSVDGEFRIATSFLADLASGALYLERQITPVHLRQVPKTRQPGRLLVEEARLYPGPAPRRLRLTSHRRGMLSVAHVDHLVALAPTEIGFLRSLVIDRLQVPFASSEIPTLFRPNFCLQQEHGAVAMDQRGEAIPVRFPREWTKPLARLLPTDSHFAFLGLLQGEGDNLAMEAIGVVSAHLRWGQGPVFPVV